ncbi:MAG: hypothetical protein KF729_28545 [Sandaracinaceae bacterium]|nr:hypothetical protein [Sandaracinaceae bacterium]
MTEARERALRGVNVPYLRGDYGHDLAPNPRFDDWPVSFDPMHAYRPLIEARDLGFEAVRLWLCENAEGLLVEDGRVVGVHDDLYRALDVIQEAAALHGVRLYPCLLDANAWPREGDPITRAILADADAAARFAERAVAPIAARLDPSLLVALEIVNEPETATSECIEPGGPAPVAWDAIGRAVRLAGEAARAERPLLVGAGTGHVFLPSLWRADPRVDLVDVHAYHANGGLPSRAQLAEYVGEPRLLDPRLPLIAGEAGIPKEDGADDDALAHYVYNADTLGYAAVFLWELEHALVEGSGRERSTTALGELIRHTLRVSAG